MTLLFLIPLIACIVSAGRATIIFMRDPNHRANRSATLLIAGVSVWALCELAWNLQSDPDVARVFVRLSAFGWAFIGPLALDVMREIATAKAAPPSLTELCAQCGAYEADERPLTADVKEWLQELLDEVRRNNVSHTDLTS